MHRREFLATIGGCVSLSTAGCTAPSRDSARGSSPSERSATETPPTTIQSSTPIPTHNIGKWSHPDYDAGGSRYVSGTTGPVTEPQAAWQVERPGIWGFAVAENRLFLLRDTACDAFDVASGEAVWQHSLPSTKMPATANITSLPGPVYANETVYVVAGTDLRALRSHDGSEQWTTSLPGGPITDMAVAGEHIYVTTGEADSGSSGHLTTVATEDGSERWRTAADQVRQPAGTLGSEVAVQEDTVAAISAEGGGSYTVTFTVEKTDGAKHWASTGQNHGRALTVTDDRVYTGGFQGYVKAQDASSGERLWEVNVGPPVETIAIDNERVYVSTTFGSGKQIAAFSLSGDEQWTTTGAGILAVADAVYITQPSTTRALDRETGKERWSVTRSSESEPVGLAVFDSTLFEATEKTVRALAKI